MLVDVVDVEDVDVDVVEVEVYVVVTKSAFCEIGPCMVTDDAAEAPV